MKKANRKWKVFVIVMCLLFTMTPGMVFADEPTDQSFVEQASGQTGGDDESNKDDQGDDGSGGDDESNKDDQDDDGSGGDDESNKDDQDDDGSGGEDLTKENEEDSAATDGALQMNFIFPPINKGTIEITKNVVNGPDRDDVFKFKISKWKDKKWKQEKIVSITGPGKITVSGLAPGEYKVEEIEIPDNYVVDDPETDKFTVGSELVPVSFTNTYTTGTITIEKRIKNGIPELQDTFTFRISKKIDKHKYQIIREVQRDGAGTIVVDGLDNGVYKVEEINLPQHYMIYGDGDPVEVTISNKDLTKEAIFTNCYTAGTIKINKTVIGNPATPGTFTFEIYKMNWSGKWVLQQEAIVNGTVPTVIPGLDYGYYKIVEQAVEGYDIDESTPKNWINEYCQHWNPNFTNTYTGPTTGSIKIIKNVTGSSIIPETVFRFTVTSDEHEYSRTVSVTGGAVFVLDGLMPGEYVVTEEKSALDFYPEGNDYDKPATVTSDSETIVTFTNIYNPELPSVTINKEVAEYTGAGVPESGFEKSKTFNVLNKSVIYRISFEYNNAWVQSERSLTLSDIYDRNGSVIDKTLDLEIWDAGTGQFVKAFPDNYVELDLDETYYFRDTLTENGIYNNVATLFEPQYRTFTEDIEPIINLSSSAVVTVNYSSGGGDNGGGNGGGGGGGSSTKYYEVIYDPNYPTSSDTSGKAPVDNKNYRYNEIVNVRGNTDGLKAGDYVFKGWNTKPDGTGTMYLQGNMFNIKEDTILYAIWELAEADPDMATTDASTDTVVNTGQSNDLDDVPKTGDSTPILLMLLMGLLSIVSVAAFSRKKKATAE